MASVTLVLLIALAELDRLSGQIVSPVDRRTHSFGSLTGPLTLVEFNPVVAGAAWEAGVRSEPAWGSWLRVHVVLDLCLIGLWALVWWRLYHATEPRPVPPIAMRIARVATRAPWTLLRWWRDRSSRRRVILLGLAWVAVTILADLGALTLTMWPSPPVGVVIGVLTIVKWTAFVVFAVAGLLWLWRDPAATLARASLVRWARAVRTQRLSLVVIAPLAVLALVPRGDISDQLPDIQRAWVDSPAGALEALWSFLALVLVCAGLFVLGRLRTDHVLQLVPGYGFRAATAADGQPADTPPSRGLAPLRLWFVLPGALALIGLGLAVSGRGAVSPWRMILFCLPSLVIGVVSLWLRRGRFHDPGLAPVPPSPDLDQYRRTGQAGDALALLLLAVGGLGLVRSYAARALLGFAPVAHDQHAMEGADQRLRIALVLALGVVGAVLPWWLPWLRHRLRPWPLAPASPRQATGSVTAAPAPGWLSRLVTPGLGRRGAEPFGVGFVVLVVAVAFGLTGWQGMGRLGVVAAALLSLAAAALVIGAIQVAGQDRHPPEIFWLGWLRRSSTPVVSLALAGLLFATVVGSGAPAAQIHLVQVRPAVEVPARPTLTVAFERWLAQRSDCGTSVTVAGRDLRIRPLMLVAAQGGGIRATYWTTSTLTLLQEGRPCRNALLSAGASGGAVGLTITRFAQPGTATGYAEELSTSHALADATHGLILRDPVFAATGVGPQADPGWVDRAAAIERAWISATSQSGASPLAGPYLATDPPAQASPTGYLVLGSTSVGTGCRVLLSQIELPAPAVLPGVPSKEGSLPVPCDATTAPAPRSYDLYAAYGTGHDASEPEEQHCVGNLDAATVALLASRFPYVTPSGIVGPCGPWRADQLVDGGYEENTGLGTIVDLGPAWLALVRQHNDAVIRGQGGETLVVPMVVFLTNGSGSDLLPGVRPITQELFVPPVALLRGGSSQNSPNALLQRTAALTQEVPWTVPGVTLTPAVNRAISAPRTFVVFPATRPSVTAPLGWTLSEASRQALADRAREQRDRRCDPAGGSTGTTGQAKETTAVVDLLCDRGYGTLGDAVALMETLSG